MKKHGIEFSFLGEEESDQLGSISLNVEEEYKTFLAERKRNLEKVDKDTNFAEVCKKAEVKTAGKFNFGKKP